MQIYNDAIELTSKSRGGKFKLWLVFFFLAQPFSCSHLTVAILPQATVFAHEKGFKFLAQL